MGWERPQYIHLQPIMRDAQHKLSKRDGDACFEEFIAKGYLKDAIINYIALLGWAPKDNREKMNMADMLEAFSVDGLSKSPSIFDINKLRWLNAQYIKELAPADFHKLMEPYYSKIEYLAGYDTAFLSALIQNRIEVLGEVGELTSFLNTWDGFDKELFVNQKQKTDKALAAELLPAILDVVKASEIYGLHDGLSALAVNKGLKAGAVMWVFRIAITGSAVTPGGATDMARLLGKERVIERLEKII